MDFGALGNIGDLLSGVGVLVTLIYLAVQVRQNTVASKTNSYQDVVTAMSEWSREIGQNGETCDILARGSQDLQTLEPVERLRFTFVMSAYFRNMENLHLKFLIGAVEESVWEGWESRLHTFFDGSPGMRFYWGINEAAFSPEFRRHVNGLLERIDDSDVSIMTFRSILEGEATA